MGWNPPSWVHCAFVDQVDKYARHQSTPRETCIWMNEMENKKRKKMHGFAVSFFPSRTYFTSFNLSLLLSHSLSLLHICTLTFSLFLSSSTSFLHYFLRYSFSSSLFPSLSISHVLYLIQCLCFFPTLCLVRTLTFSLFLSFSTSSFVIFFVILFLLFSFSHPLSLTHFLAHALPRSVCLYFSLTYALSRTYFTFSLFLSSSTPFLYCFLRYSFSSSLFPSLSISPVLYLVQCLCFSPTHSLYCTYIL
jgi:hypothetical protein